MNRTNQAEDFEAYQDQLDFAVWPNSKPGFGDSYTAVADMAPQHAAAALAKLVRWARHAPAGEAALQPDEDSREDFVRRSMLGTALAARACNLTPEHFYGVYGEYGSATDADLHEQMAELAVDLGDLGLEDWTLPQRLTLASKLLERMLGRVRITQRRS